MHIYLCWALAPARECVLIVCLELLQHVGAIARVEVRCEPCDAAVQLLVGTRMRRAWGEGPGVPGAVQHQGWEAVCQPTAQSLKSSVTVGIGFWPKTLQQKKTALCGISSSRHTAYINANPLSNQCPWPLCMGVCSKINLFASRKAPNSKQCQDSSMRATVLTHQAAGESAQHHSNTKPMLPCV